MANNKRGPEPGSQKAKRGGQAVREKYGTEFYSRIGKKGGETVKEKRGPKFYAEIGKKGGESTKRQQGAAFYSKIGKKGGEHGRAVAADKDVKGADLSGRDTTSKTEACSHPRLLIRPPP